MISFPTELLIIIFSKLDLKSRLVCKTVCWRWLEIMMTCKKFNRDQTLYFYDCNLSDNTFPVQLLTNLIFPYSRINIIVSQAFHCDDKFSTDIWNKIQYINIYSLYDDRMFYNLLESWICSSNKYLKLTVFYKSGISQVKQFKVSSTTTSASYFTTTNTPNYATTTTEPFFDCYEFRKTIIHNNIQNTFTCSRSELELTNNIINYICNYSFSYPNDFKFTVCNELKDDIYYLEKYNFLLKDINSLEILYNDKDARFKYVGKSLPHITNLSLTIWNIDNNLLMLIPKKYPNLNILELQSVDSMDYSNITDFDTLLMGLPCLKHLKINFLFCKDNVDLTTSLIKYGSNLQVHE